MARKNYPDFEQIQKLKEQQIASDSRKVVYIDEDQALYRGVTIDRRDHIPSGQWGRYVVSLYSLKNRHTVSSQSEAKSYIDGLVEAKRGA